MGFRRWLSIQQSNQRILAKPVETLPIPATIFRQHRHDDISPNIENDTRSDDYQVTTPEDQVHQWLDEVKEEFRNNDEKDKENDHRN